MKMKNLLLSILFSFLMLTGCSNDDDAPNHLPPATQTGAGTFACLVNGEVFVHNDGLINCFYQYVDGGYYFRISGQVEEEKNITSVSVGTERKEIEEGATYQLLTREIGNPYGGGLLKLVQ